MFLTGRLACISLAALALGAPSEARAGASIDSIHLTCPQQEADGFCDILRQVMSETYPAKRVTLCEPSSGSSGFSIEFRLARRTAQMLAGRLVWHDEAGRTANGPELELTVMDAQVTERLLRGYARDLLRFSDLPL